MSNPPKRRPYYFSQMTRIHRRCFGVGMFLTSAVLSLFYPDAIFAAVRKEIQKREPEVSEDTEYLMWLAAAQGVKETLARITEDNYSVVTDEDITAIVNSVMQANQARPN